MNWLNEPIKKIINKGRKIHGQKAYPAMDFNVNLNSYNVRYFPLKFVPLFLGHPAYKIDVDITNLRKLLNSKMRITKGNGLVKDPLNFTWKKLFLKMTNIFKVTYDNVVQLMYFSLLETECNNRKFKLLSKTAEVQCILRYNPE